MTGSGGTFTNPVIQGFHPDPSICRVDDRFYLVVSSFEYFPGIPLFTSTDLVSWTQLGHVLDRPSQLDLSGAPASGGIYAPTIRVHDGLFFVTSTNVSGGGHFIVHAKDPAGPWSEPVWVDQNGIDPSLFFEDGLVYFTSNVAPNTTSGPHVMHAGFERGIQQSLVDPLTGRLLSEPQFIWAGTGGRFPEAPHLFRRGDYYYLVIAEGGTEYGHMATLARSHSPWGPFTPSPHGPLTSHRSIASPLHAVGHADLVTLPNGDWWLVCLGVRPVGHWPRHLLGRETLLAAVRWTEDGWPLVGERGEVPLIHSRPPLAADAIPEKAPLDDFDSPSLGSEWTFVRRPMDPERLHARRGWLTLVPGEPLDSRFPSFVGRRQQHYRFRAETLLDFMPLQDGDEAGLAVRMNETHFYTWGVAWRGESRDLVLRLRAGHVSVCSTVGTVEDGDVVLSVRGDADSYVFSARTASGRTLTADPADTKFLTTEFAGGFTGVFVGVYASSTGCVGGADAAFDWFSYEAQGADPSAPAPRESVSVP